MMLHRPASLGLTFALLLVACGDASVPHESYPAAPGGKAGTIPAIWAPGQSLAWVLYRGKTEVGVSWGRYVGPRQRDGRTVHRFESRVDFDGRALGVPDTSRLQERAILDTDERGRPIHFSLKRNPGPPVELFVRRRRVAGSVGDRRVNLTLDEPGAFLLARYHVFLEDLLLSLQPPPRDWAPHPAGGEPGMGPGRKDAGTPPATTHQPKGKFLEVPGILARGRTIAVHYHLTETGELTNNFGEKIRRSRGHIERVTTPGVGFHYVRRQRKAPRIDIQARARPVYRRPADATWRDRLVSFRASGAATLAGTLSVPTKGPERKPAVIFLSGPGLQNRHGQDAETDYGYWQILDTLAGAGFVVLRLDDRGAGHSTPGVITKGIGFTTLVDDARRAVRFLAKDKAVDRSRIYAIGHSEGALVAAVLAADPPHVTPPVRALALLAPPARPLTDLLRMQQDKRVWSRLPAKAAKRRRAIFDALIDAVKKQRTPDPSKVPPSVWRARLPTARWLAQHALLPIKRLWGRIARPTLIVQGAKDPFLPAPAEAESVAKLIRDGGNPAVTVEILPGLGHRFKPVPGAWSPALDKDPQRRIAPALLSTLTAWLKQQ